MTQSEPPCTGIEPVGTDEGLRVVRNVERRRRAVLRLLRSLPGVDRVRPVPPCRHCADRCRSGTRAPGRRAGRPPRRRPSPGPPAAPAPRLPRARAHRTSQPGPGDATSGTGDQRIPVGATPAAGQPEGASPPATRLARALDALARCRELAVSRGRSDLVDRLDAAAVAAGERTMPVVVVGEFKRGKSTLVNALLQTAACPVDADIVTVAPTIVRLRPPTVGDGLPGAGRRRVRGSRGARRTSRSRRPISPSPGTPTTVATCARSNSCCRTACCAPALSLSTPRGSVGSTPPTASSPSVRWPERRACCSSPMRPAS